VEEEAEATRSNVREPGREEKPDLGKAKRIEAHEKTRRLSQESRLKAQKKKPAKRFNCCSRNKSMNLGWSSTNV
jgi:hypothetical protein